MSEWQLSRQKIISWDLFDMLEKSYTSKLKVLLETYITYYMNSLRIKKYGMKGNRKEGLKFKNLIDGRS